MKGYVHMPFLVAALSYVLTEARGAHLQEGNVAIDEYGRLVRWLSGGTPDV